MDRNRDEHPLQTGNRFGRRFTSAGSVASLSDQLRRDQKWCLYIDEQIARIETGAPNHAGIAYAAGLTRSRVPQILNLANLDPNIQQTMLALADHPTDGPA